MSQSYDNLIELCEDPGLSGVRDVLCDDKARLQGFLNVIVLRNLITMQIRISVQNQGQEKVLIRNLAIILPQKETASKKKLQK